MNDPKVIRAILAVLVVGVFMSITAVMALFPLFSPTEVVLNDYADFLSKISGIYSGIIGVIIGYYFGQSKTDSGTEKKQQT